jgi:Peptidase family M23
VRRLGVLLLCALALPAASARAWTWPVEGQVVRGFNFDRAHPYAGGQHRGIDVSAAIGAPVLAPAEGVVSFAGTVPSGGKTISIQTPFATTVTLLHLGSIGVTRGALVNEGSVVGAVGPSVDPDLPEPHVYLGIRTTADPQGYLDPLSVLPPRAVDPGPAPDPAPVVDPAPAVDPAVDPAPGVDPAPAVDPGSGSDPAPGVEPAPAPDPVPAVDPGSTGEEPPVADSDVTPPLDAQAPAAAESAADASAESTTVAPAAPGRLDPVGSGAAVRGGTASPAEAPVQVTVQAPAQTTALIGARPGAARPLEIAGSRPAPGAMHGEAPPHDPGLDPSIAARSTSGHGRRTLLATVGAAISAALLLMIGVAMKGRRAAAKAVRMMTLPEPEAVIARNDAEERPRRTGLAVCGGPTAPRSRGGVCRASGHLRAVPPPEGEPRLDGQWHGRARYAGDGDGGQRRRVAA